MGIRLLLLLFSIVLVAMGILFYFLLNEIETLQKEIKNLNLINNQTENKIQDIIDYLMSQNNGE